MSLEEFRVVLKLYGWVPKWADEPSKVLWGEMEAMSIREMALQEKVEMDMETMQLEGELDAEFEVDD
jgi:hypothetical protein